MIDIDAPAPRFDAIRARCLKGHVFTVDVPPDATAGVRNAAVRAASCPTCGSSTASP